MSQQLIVAGFHRSGTSLVCQLLNQAGLFLGYDLFEANFSNPHGHFEDLEILKLHERILSDNGLTWQVDTPLVPIITGDSWREMRRIVERRNAEHSLWGFKDPRVCSFLMVWKHLLPAAKVLLVYRHFSDATYSLAQRHATLLLRNRGRMYLHRRFWEQPDLALRMWLVSNELLLTFAQIYPEDTLAVSMEMVRSGFPVVEAIEKRWGLDLKNVAGPGVFDASVTGGRRGRQPVSDVRLIERVERTWRALEGLGERTQRMVG